MKDSSTIQRIVDGIKTAFHAVQRIVDIQRLWNGQGSLLEKSKHSNKVENSSKKIENSS